MLSRFCQQINLDGKTWQDFQIIQNTLPFKIWFHCACDVQNNLVSVQKKFICLQKGEYMAKRLKGLNICKRRFKAIKGSKNVWPLKVKSGDDLMEFSLNIYEK